MDAKITKERLANFLAYDWLKIVAIIAAVIIALCVLFTTVQTRPREDQTFEIYGYGLTFGADGYNFSVTALEDHVFSYDVLEVTTEAIDINGTYGSTIYTARRSAGQGEVMFVPQAKALTDRLDENGEYVISTVLDEYVRSSLYDEGGENEQLIGLHDARAFMQDCESYLKSVFGEGYLTNDIPSDDVVREYFLARNKRDKRFRTQAKREAGIAQERERLIALRSAYMRVADALDSNKISYTDYTSKGGKTYTVGINLGGGEDCSGLPNLYQFVYYNARSEDGTSAVRSSQDLTLTVLSSSKETDLHYDAVFFISWLLEAYA